MRKHGRVLLNNLISNKRDLEPVSAELCESVHGVLKGGGAEPPCSSRSPDHVSDRRWRIFPFPGNFMRDFRPKETFDGAKGNSSRRKKCFNTLVVIHASFLVLDSTPTLLSFEFGAHLYGVRGAAGWHSQCGVVTPLECAGTCAVRTALCAVERDTDAGRERASRF